MCEGEDLVEAARAAGIEPVELLVAGEDVEPALLAELSTLGAPAARDRRLPARRPAARSAAADARALARRRPGQRRHADAHRRRVRRRRRALRGLRRPDRAEGAARVGRRDLPRAARAVRRGAAAVDRARRPRRHAAGRVLDSGHGSFVLGAEREGLPADVSRAATRSATIPLAPARSRSTWPRPARSRCTKHDGKAEQGDRTRGDQPTATRCGRSIRARREPARGRACSDVQTVHRAEDASRENGAERQRIAGADVASLHADRAAGRRDAAFSVARLEPDDRAPAWTRGSSNAAPSVPTVHRPAALPDGDVQVDDVGVRGAEEREPVAESRPCACRAAAASRSGRRASRARCETSRSASRLRAGSAAVHESDGCAKSSPRCMVTCHVAAVGASRGDRSRARARRGRRSARA